MVQVFQTYFLGQKDMGNGQSSKLATSLLLRQVIIQLISIFFYKYFAKQAILFSFVFTKPTTMAAPKLILLEPNCVYHIFAHAVHANDFFYDDENKRFFLEKWKHFSKGYFKTYAYCLLSNHFHFAVKVEKEAVLRATIEEQRLLRAQKKLKLFDLELVASSCRKFATCDKF
jgi:hypothetical protein